MRARARLLAAAFAMLAPLALGAAPAAAKVIHLKEGSFNGGEAPSGPFGPLLVSDAVDQSSGDVYVSESNAFGIGQNVIDKFDGAGKYAAVQITGSKVKGQETFAFGLFSGLAVDNSFSATKGDLYVGDTGNRALERFSAAGKFLCEITAKTPISEAEKKHECNGEAGSAPPACKEEPAACAITPAGVAVDQSGDVFVADDAHAVIDEFGAAGEYLSQITDPHLSGSLGTIALDSEGNLYVQLEATRPTVLKFDSSGSFSSVLDSHEAFSVGVDRKTNHVYVFELEEGHEQIAEYDPAGVLLSVIATPDQIVLGLAADGKLYAAESNPSGEPGSVAIYSPDIAVPTASTGAATNLSETGATLTGHIDPDTVHGGGEVSECVFEYGTSTAYGQTAPCSPPAPYMSAADVSAGISGLTPATTYHYRVKAKNSNGFGEGEDQTFATAGPAVIDAQAVRVSGVKVEFKGQINPLHLDTACHVQYVEDASFQSSGYAAASTVPCAPEDLGAGFGDQGASAMVGGLKVATTYHYRFLASSTAGTTQGANKKFITFGANSINFALIDKEGNPFTQAAGHPYELATSFAVNWSENPGGAPHSGEHAEETLTGNLKDVLADLPPGLIGDPGAAPKCTRADLKGQTCPGAAQVGLAMVNITAENGFSFPNPSKVVGIYNLVPPKGVAAEFGFSVYQSAEGFIDAKLRSGGDYGVTTEALNTTTLAGVEEVFVHFWGVPGDASHDEWRFCPAPNGGLTKGCSLNEPNPKPFLRNPTSCSGPLTTTLSFDSWQAPGLFDEHAIEMGEITGCPEVKFTPSIEVQPTTSEADTPTGLHVDLHIPQNEEAEGLAESDLKDTKVTLPAGLSTNASAANGLQACSPAQVGLTSAPDVAPVTFTPDPAQCPDAAKIGTVEVDTPLLDHPLPGAVFIATPYQNPFDSLLAIYIAIYDPQSGVVVKLAGHVQPDPQTGQLTTTFSESPQVPFEDFKLDFFAGPRAALATPEACGSYTPSASFTPWSSTTPVSPEIAPFAVSAGCVSGFSPSFSAGSASPQAGAYSSLQLSFARKDTDQELSGLSVTLPSGLVGKLAGVSQCSDAQLAAAAAKSGAQEAANPSCPEGSQLGTVQTFAGAGETPIGVSGKAYLTGPYNGGPYGLAVVVPALAGPFDLGTVVVRQSLRIDPHTAQVTAVSDPLPSILKGIPIRLRRVDVSIDRPRFTLNPTSCNPLAFTGTLTSTAGLSAALSQRFQAGGCQGLRFNPRFGASTQASTSKANGASLEVKVAQSPGEANIAKVDVSLPLALPSRLTTLQKACPGAQFASDPSGCPAGSLVGSATARTPLLANPLSGPAYLVSHGAAAFPDLVVVLHGEGITIELTGNTDIKRGITYSHFDTVPDAPISSFELTLPEGPHSALAANANLCSATSTVTVKKRVRRRVHGKLRHVLRSVKQQVPAPLLMPTTITAQNGAVIRQTTKIAVAGCPAQKKKARHAKKKRTRHAKKGR
jgi:hypothetical protein